jgi:hypothetical protein
MKDMKSTWFKHGCMRITQKNLNGAFASNRQVGTNAESTRFHTNETEWMWNAWVNLFFFMNLHESVSESGMERMLEFKKVNVKPKRKYWWKKEKMKIFFRKKSMQFTNPNAHTYVNGTDVETHREEHLIEFSHEPHNFLMNLTICDLKIDISCETSINFVECGV